MSTSRSTPVALVFRDVTKTFAHNTGRRLLRDRLADAVKSSAEGRFTALDGVSFELVQGESLGLIGPNGAGKSTLLNIATGLSLPDRGDVEVHGRVAAMLELGAGFHPDLTGAENLKLYAAFLGMTRAETASKYESIMDFAGIGDFADDPLRTYSSGMTVRLAFSVAVHTDPDVLLMDEVIGLGDQAFYARCLEKIRDFQRQGKTIVLASHSVELLTMLCQRALWLDRGRVVQLGASSQVAAAYQAGGANAASR
jgi:ABC-type polysaccharide/polyol phosphate transport system ATPase subunit